MIYLNKCNTLTRQIFTFIAKYRHHYNVTVSKMDKQLNANHVYLVGLFQKWIKVFA